MSALDRYWPLWLRLDALCEAGRGESAEAEALRDEMDAPWRGLLETDRAELLLRVACYEADRRAKSCLTATAPRP